MVLNVKQLHLSPENYFGNKDYKLLLNLKEAIAYKHKTVITFGGAYSNHIQATAVLGKKLDLKTIGIIRGEELATSFKHTLQTNTTLREAHNNGMSFLFISRERYREKHTSHFKEDLLTTYPNAYIIPEGGTNTLAVKGCESILDKHDLDYNFICCPIGTGGTISGIINASKPHQTVLGFPALKGNFLESEIKKYTTKTNWKLITKYHFGGYAKYNQALIEYINSYKVKTNILLDPIYTGKMMYGIQDLIKHEFFPQNSRILAIHTGGLQGIHGMNQKLLKKGLPIIKL